MRTDRRKMIHNSTLPYSYKKLKYLYVTNNAYIDTGIMAKTFYIEVDLYMKVEVLSYAACLWCARNTNNNTNSVLFFSARYTKGARYDVGESGQNFPVNHDILTNIKGLSKELYFNRTLAYVSYGNNNNNNNSNLLLFASKFNTNNNSEVVNNSFNNIAVHKIFQIRISKGSNNKLDAHFVPAKRKSDGVIGMYDLVGRKFYTSPNGVAFTGGGKI